MDLLLSILASPWLNGLGLIAGVIFAAFGLWLTVRYRVHNNLRYGLRSQKLISISPQFSFIAPVLDGAPIERLNGSTIIFWNGGNKSLRSFDMRVPLTISANLPRGERGRFYAWEVSFVDSSDGNFRIEQVDGDLNLLFDTLGPMEGVIVSITHNFNGSYLAISGSTHESKKIERRFPLKVYQYVSEGMLFGLFCTYFILCSMLYIYLGSGEPVGQPPVVTTYKGVMFILLLALMFGPPALLTAGTYRPVRKIVDRLMLANVPQSFFEFNREVDRPKSKGFAKSAEVA